MLPAAPAPPPPSSAGAERVPQRLPAGPASGGKAAPQHPPAASGAPRTAASARPPPGPAVPYLRRRPSDAERLPLPRSSHRTPQPKWPPPPRRCAVPPVPAAGPPPPAECAVSRWTGSSRELPPSSSRPLLLFLLPRAPGSDTPHRRCSASPGAARRSGRGRRAGGGVGPGPARTLPALEAPSAAPRSPHCHLPHGRSLRPVTAQPPAPWQPRYHPCKGLAITSCTVQLSSPIASFTSPLHQLSQQLYHIFFITLKAI